MKNVGLKDQPIHLVITKTGEFDLSCNSCKKTLHKTTLKTESGADRADEAIGLVRLYTDEHRCPGSRLARVLIAFACAIGAEEQLIAKLRASNLIH